MYTPPRIEMGTSYPELISTLSKTINMLHQQRHKIIKEHNDKQNFKQTTAFSDLGNRIQTFEHELSDAQDGHKRGQ